jgi:hypothetical protein
MMLAPQKVGDMGHPASKFLPFFWRGGVCVFAGVFAKNEVQNVVF